MRVYEVTICHVITCEKNSTNLKSLCTRKVPLPTVAKHNLVRYVLVFNQFLHKFFRLCVLILWVYMSDKLSLGVYWESHSETMRSFERYVGESIAYSQSLLQLFRLIADGFKTTQVEFPLEMNTFERKKTLVSQQNEITSLREGGKNNEKVVYINCRYDRISGTLCLRSRAKTLGTTYQRSDWLMVSRQNIFR